MDDDDYALGFMHGICLLLCMMMTMHDHTTMHSKTSWFLSAFGKETRTFIKEGKSQNPVQQLY